MKPYVYEDAHIMYTYKYINVNKKKNFDAGGSDNVKMMFRPAVVADKSHRIER